jgi:23S rRNA (cytosine1962-C5)-methyltransferase
MSIIKITLKPGKEQSMLRFHPWIFSGAIKTMDSQPQEGDLVEVYSNKNEFLAKGHYQIGSIAVRVVTFTNETVDYEFWKRKVLKAFQLREKLGLAKSPITDVYRLIHGEGDNMPGLIVDIYGKVAVMQSHSVGMFKIKDTIAKAIIEIYGGAITAVYDKSEGTLPFKANLNPKNGYLIGSEGTSATVTEYGNKFIVDWQEGQKTGFFVDQRENRKLVENYSQNKAVLNVFGYTGGFSVYALKGGASLVHSVDSSERATELTSQNVLLNFSNANHEAFAVDAFEYLNTIDGKYDLIILDPPAFAKHQNVLQNALQGYKKLNAKAIARIKPGGILFTFSCSQVVSKLHFREAVFSAAAIAKRQVRILHQLSQPTDHPINIYHPEGEYLKGLVVYVE